MPELVGPERAHEPGECIDLDTAWGDYVAKRDSIERPLLKTLNKQLGKSMTAFAVLLIAVLVVQTPVAMVDQVLHASGQTHQANAFAGPLSIDLADHDHDHHVDQDHHDDDAVDAIATAADDDRDPAPSQGPHHHHDGPSLLGLVTTVALASPWSASPASWSGRETALPSAKLSPEKRPPKSSLEYIV